MYSLHSIRESKIKNRTNECLSSKLSRTVQPRTRQVAALIQDNLDCDHHKVKKPELYGDV